MKTQRHAAIVRIIRRDTVGSQEQLRELLRAEGFEVTQATLSRDIRELGLAKVAAPDGGSHYAESSEGTSGVRPHLEQIAWAVEKARQTASEVTGLCGREPGPPESSPHLNGGSS